MPSNIAAVTPVIAACPSTNAPRLNRTRDVVLGASGIQQHLPATRAPSEGRPIGICSLHRGSALRRYLRRYVSLNLLVGGTIGYLSDSNRHADLMLELVSHSYQRRSKPITTNRPFVEWREVFPDAALAVSVIDRLVCNAAIIAIEGDSYRLRKARERTEPRARRCWQLPS
jgi:hypothetical protein